MIYFLQSTTKHHQNSNQPTAQYHECKYASSDLKRVLFPKQTGKFAGGNYRLVILLTINCHILPGTKDTKYHLGLDPTKNSSISESDFITRMLLKMFINNIASHSHHYAFTSHYYYIVYLYISVSYISCFIVLTYSLCARLQFDNWY